ncbi:MAG: hypothetical protein JJW01_00290 [Alphaproteobacteria bacterium]|nr:hypothetical protein [Rickettsiales bacterium]
MKNIRSWIGVQFRYRGYTKSGCDCAGLILGILQENNICDKDLIKKYLNHSVRNSEYIDEEKILNSLDKVFKRGVVDDVRLSDILVMKSSCNNIVHLGIVSRINPLYMLHAHGKIGCVVESIVDKPILDKVFLVYHCNLLALN